MKLVLPALVLVAGIAFAQNAGPKVVTPVAGGREAENAKVAMAFIDAMNARDTTKAGSLVSSTFTITEPTAPAPLNFPGYLQLFGGILAAMPDFSLDLYLVVASGDYVVLHWTARGTHTGPFQASPTKTAPQSGKAVSFNGSSTLEFAGGKIASGRAHWDVLTLMTQLGAMP